MFQERVYNFSAGPAVLPGPVLEQARLELLNWEGTGASVVEVSHRSPEFSAIADRADDDLRKLLKVPENYNILFLQGGATLQFAAVPLNLARKESIVDYAITGSWGKKAQAEATRYAHTNIVTDAANNQYTCIPDPATWKVSSDAVYLHYTPNETIHGVEFHFIPEVSDSPLIVDMSSTILSQPVDIARFGLIYAGAQKNIGPAGITIVIVREDLIGRARLETPSVVNYQVMAGSGSMSNTPPTFAWYMSGLVFQWLQKQGGLSAMADLNKRKSSKLYAAIDASDFYSNAVDSACRSRMNIPFTLADPKLDATFIERASQVGITNIRGHRSIGGMRASLYNAMPEKGVDALLSFMADFVARYG